MRDINTDSCLISCRHYSLKMTLLINNIMYLISMQTDENIVSRLNKILTV